MTGLTTHGRPTSSAAAIASSRLSAKHVARGLEPQLARGEFADAVAVHGQLHRLGRRRDAPAFASSSASVAVSIASISGTMTSGRCFSTAARKAAAVEHREDLGRVRASASPARSHSGRRRSPGSRAAWRRWRIRGRARPIRAASKWQDTWARRSNGLERARNPRDGRQTDAAMRRGMIDAPTPVAICLRRRRC